MVFFAGLWDRWIAAHGAPLLGFTVLTAPAEGRLKTLHDRRPVMVPPEKAGVWLQGSLPDVPEFLAGLPLPELAWHPVAADVGNVRAEGPELIAEVPRVLDSDLRAVRSGGASRSMRCPSVPIGLRYGRHADARTGQGDPDALRPHPDCPQFEGRGAQRPTEVSPPTEN